MEVRRYVPSDLLAIDLQPMQQVPSAALDEQTAKNLGESDAYTATVDGEVIACVGLITFWPGRRFAWAYLSAQAGRHMVMLTWKIRRWLRYHGAGRIEAAIDPEFKAAVEWAGLLGFHNETPGHMEEYVTGKAYDLYARIGR